MSNARHKLLWGWGVLTLVILLALSGGSAVQARPLGKSVEVVQRNGDITILPNGDVQVVETWEVVFHGGPFHYAFREIPLNRVEDITDWSVSEGDIDYLLDEDGDQPYTYKVEASGDSRRISWYFPSTEDAARVFTLRYTLKGALWIDEDGDQFFWKFIESDRAYPIESATVILHLPASFSKSQLLTATYLNRVPGPAAEMLDERTLRFQGGPFEAGEEWEIRVQWPHGVVTASPPSWEWRFRLQPWINLGWLLLFFLVAAVSWGGAFLLWYFRGRDPAVGKVPDFLPEPPSELPPGMVGVLVDERADLDDILATLLDLARRGFLRIETIKHRLTSEETNFIAQEWPEQPLPFELEVLHAIFGPDVKPGKVRSLSSLRNKFYTHLPDLKAKLYQAVVSAGLFPDAPDKVRRRYTFIAFGVGLLVASLYFPASWMGTGGLASLAFIIGFVAAAIWLGIAGAMPRKTRKGALEAARWEAFRRYLRHLERYTQVEKAKDLFERYLPYATAFGLSQTWVRKFARVPEMPMPGWYAMRLPTMTTTADGSSTGSMGGHLASQPAQAPSLNTMAEGMMGSFNDLADSLIGTLNDAASTFTSVPQSSSSGGWSSGGWSSGGFSGGGGGGFGGGGGSSGFG